jgi:hypothetical protein
MENLYRILTTLAVIVLTVLLVAGAVTSVKSKESSNLRPTDLIYSNVFCKSYGEVSVAAALKAIGNHETYEKWTTPGRNKHSACEDKAITGKLRTVKPMRLIRLQERFAYEGAWFELWYVVNDRQEYGYTYITGRH